MAMDFSEALQLVGPFVAIAGFISGVWYKVEGKIDTVRSDAAAQAAAAQVKAETAQKELADFKLKVVEEYASWDTVRSIESRLTERMDSLTEQVMKMPDLIVDRIVNMIKLSSK
ncbi:hypothetical protein [Bradyrhizobium ottawaense]|uniref:Uncharacterized protein n=1 Tax=Bradyrhizobium ottawaense TaxID=931866 RepID=A0ABY0QH24_9BRAD|nr:hypothetical protein [Bradyrhizobium ottawaense]SDK39563.1 hypothetical protein SAMN05444163_8013 [Bradyrhizobium ottawaense]